MAQEMKKVEKKALGRMEVQEEDRARRREYITHLPKLVGKKIAESQKMVS